MILLYLTMVMRREWHEPPPTNIEVIINKNYTKKFTLKDYPVDDQDTIDQLVNAWLGYFWENAVGVENCLLRNYVNGQFILSKQKNKVLRLKIN